MKLKTKIKEVPGLQYVADSIEVMSAAGRRRMLEQDFLTDAQQLSLEQNIVASVRQVLQTPALNAHLIHLRHQLMQLHDIHSTIQNLSSHYLLNEVELFEIKNLAHLCRNARQSLAEMQLQDVFPLPNLDGVFQLLDPDKTGLPNFYIYDSYDNRLAPLRKQMREADDVLMGELLSQQNTIQQEVITHLCDQLQSSVSDLATAMEQMAYIDFTLARATLAETWQLHQPETLNNSFTLEGLFNPRLKAHNTAAGLRYQPVDISLTSGVTLITGANMAGKTVLLKSVGVAQLMYQFGFPVPATTASLKPVDDVVFCIGDEQNEMNGLSSFAAEITRINSILQRSRSENLLVLIDEPARTTNPVEGKALVQALAKILSSKDSTTLITTHYSQLGINCRRLRVKGFVEALADAPLTANNINRFLDYSLIPDDSDEAPQEALRIAEMLNSDPELIAEARKALLQ